MPAYLSGFGNHHASEALPGALPEGQNSPQTCPYGLYAEQLSGTPFTAPRTQNRRSWLYRIRPTLSHWGAFQKVETGDWRSAPAREVEVPPQPLRWNPLPLPDGEVAFPQGVHTLTTCGDAGAGHGMAASVYALTRSMHDAYFYNADAEMLFVPQQGDLCFHTEMGLIEAEPAEIVVIPRGVKFRLEIDGPVRGYLCENYGAPFQLPERGPIGANGLANERDFLYPQAAFEDREAPSKMYVKWGGDLWATDLAHSPLDVVAWHGNHAPYRYDLRRFCPMGPILFDHADPSIFTVLTSPSEVPGTANIDLVIFPDRWLVAEHSFRPPWYHMNIMSEFMGLIHGQYDAKPNGFAPGAASLHNRLIPHGPDAEVFAAANHTDLKPQKLEGTLAFMLETRLPQQVTRWAWKSSMRQVEYGLYGQKLEPHFLSPLPEGEGSAKTIGFEQGEGEMFQSEPPAGSSPSPGLDRPPSPSGRGKGRAT
ncbi:homogentisate 1,2-dioxygenase [Asticcacaulis sp. BYS171W]|uniref:Homogentisate 1,2-dioxygenase n=1 Tax=Asticcacaulis aquaticus TaxID=2984212 RepID=A0ABT5HU57_9CAUL|nr:homogentisate 1,2-dioxygenase [Asticcacaulis aquaticus]MDC7683606.1 homogentisate 1,2-dioxygenase [Asticcacaulis aquaticus]